MSTFCSYFNQGICRSCDLLNFDYSTQIEIKEKLLIEALADIDHPPLLKTVQSPQTKFRNKAKFAVTGTQEEPIIGLWGENNPDKGRELLNCDLHVKPINDLVLDLKKFISTCKLPPYEISSQKGELKGIIIFHCEESEESYLRFILRSKEAVTRIKKYTSEFLTKNPQIKSLSVNIQPIPHAFLEGEEEIFITDQKSIRYQLGDFSFSLDPKAFVQTNLKIAQILYQTASEWINQTKRKKFLELFCGQGAFSFFSANSIEEGLGIEINPHAVQMANETAKNLGIKKLKFKCADAGKVEDEILTFRPDILLVNPPRRGLDEACYLLLNSGADFIIYSSCHYQTLANDLKKMIHKYSIEKIQLFDMFPNTHHFETLVLLRRKT